MTLALLGGVTQVKATKLYVNVDNVSWWFGDDAKLDMYSWQNEDISVNTGWDNHIIISPTYMYGGRWYVYEMPTGHDRAIVRRNVGGNFYNQTWDITVSDDYYIYLKDNNEAKLGWDEVSAPTWNGLCIRSSVDGYEGYTNNMECSDGNNTFTKAYTKAEFGDATYFYFRLKHIENVKFGEDGTFFDTWTQVGPTTNDTPMALATTLTTTNQFSDATYNNWQITLPTYNYEKIVITAKYIYDEGYKWKVSADAYISKTVSGTYHYATLGAPTATPLDLSGLAAKGIVAYTAEANTSTKKVTLTEKTTNLAGGEGVLLYNASDADVVLSIPVAATGDASVSNDLKTFSGTGSLMQEAGYTRYILANEGGDTGFYKVNTITGNVMGTNTAYLEVTGEVASRSFLWEGETTSISAIHNAHETNGQFFNLAGQRIAQPTKGLYIVNGKKVIIK